MPDNQDPLLVKEGNSTPRTPLLKLKQWQWWFLVALNIIFVLGGQLAGVLLQKDYYDQGGNSKWMITIVPTVAFPFLFIPYCLLPPSQQPSTSSSSLPSTTIVFLIYFVLGVLIAVDNLLYSVGLIYLPASTYSLLCATQLAFNAVFSFFINSQKFTFLIFNSVVVLSLSASLLAVNDDTDGPSGASQWKYIIGIATTLAGSALYSLILCLMQLSFQTVMKKKETFVVVLEMQLFTSLFATCVSLLGLFGSEEWKTLHREMDGFDKGRVSYVMTLVWMAVAWQVCYVGVVGLIFLVSSLFSNVIGTVSLALTPIAAVIVFQDSMNGVKVIALLLALWGFASYTYQNFLDDFEIKEKNVNTIY